MWRMRGVFSALLSLSLSAATTVAWTPVTNAAPGYDTGPTPAAPQPVSAPELHWGSCSQVIKTPGDVPSAQCGVVAVPVDIGKGPVAHPQDEERERDQHNDRGARREAEEDSR